MKVYAGVPSARGGLLASFADLRPEMARQVRWHYRQLRLGGVDACLARMAISGAFIAGHSAGRSRGREDILNPPAEKAS